MKSPISTKIRTLAISTLAAAVLSIPAAATLSVSAYAAAGHSQGHGIKPYSHRLAVGHCIKHLSLRLV